MRHALFTCCALLMAHVGSTQTIPPLTVTPPAAGHTMVHAAGMPLNDGALPPGMLTVRIVRGAFTADVPEQDVTVDLAGGKRETARTGADGRAQFAHLPVGAQVRVATAVEGQQLRSEAFVLPAESGVRVLFVVDDGTRFPVTADANVVQASALPLRTSAADFAGYSPRRVPSTGVLAIRIVFTVATLAAFAFVLFRQTTPRRRP